MVSLGSYYIYWWVQVRKVLKGQYFLQASTVALSRKLAAIQR